MQHLQLANGDTLPVLGLGTWKSAPGEVYNAVREAIRIGYRHIDCAAIYLNESEIGQALADAIDEGDVKREDLWITSKLWNNAHEKDQVIPALKKTLRDLQLSYLDLYLIHWPVALKTDVMFPQTADDFISLDDVPLADTWQMMEACVREGLTRHIGVSNFNIPKIQGLFKTATIRPEVNQVELHPHLVQDELVNFCKENDIIVTAYSPLGSRDRTAEMKADDEPDMLQNPVIVAIAESHDISPAQVLLSWAVNRGTTVIPKSVNPERLKQNIQAADIRLSDTDMERINGLNKGYRYVKGDFWEFEGGPYTMDGLWNK